MTTASNWLLNWAIAYSTPYMTDAIHTNVFWIWAGFCCVRTVKFQTSDHRTLLTLHRRPVSRLYIFVSTRPRDSLWSKSTSSTARFPRPGSPRASYPLFPSKKYKMLRAVPIVTCLLQRLRTMLCARRVLLTRRILWVRSTETTEFQDLCYLVSC
jgi:hypothetical protein